MTSPRKSLLPLACACLALAVPAAAGAAPAVPGEIVVHYEPGSPRVERAAARREAGVRAVRGLGIAGTQLVEVGEGATAEALAELRRDPAVRHASPNWLRRPAATPNDPSFHLLWGLHNTGQEVAGITGTADADIDAPEAWDIQPGWGEGSEQGVVVAVMDTGVDLGHPELDGNLWTNAAEAAGDPGVDDDLNGYVDDVHGYDFAGESLEDATDGDPDPEDPDGHGTHVSGTVLAEGDNGEGVVGVAPGAGLMALKVCALDDESEAWCPLDAMLAAYAYALDNGADVVNGSLGGPGYSPAELTLLGSSPQTLFVFAAGNGGEDGVGDDNDSEPSYPCALDEEAGYAADNLICVAATDQHDGLAGFSNYGSESVDLGAPGSRWILSLYPRAFSSGYVYMAGTSMATPQVTGVAALMLTALPSTSTAALKAAILAAAEPKSALSGKTVTGGRLNARLALEELGLEAPVGEEEPTEEPEDESPPESGTEGGGGEPPPEESTAPAAPPSSAPAPTAEPVSAPRLLAWFKRRPRKVVRTRFRRAKVVFRFASNRRRVEFLCRLDGRPWRRCGRRVAWRLEARRHVLRVRALDALSRGISGRPAVYRFRVVRVGR